MVWRSSPYQDCSCVYECMLLFISKKNIFLFISDNIYINDIFHMNNNNNNNNNSMSVQNEVTTTTTTTAAAAASSSTLPLDTKPKKRKICNTENGTTRKRKRRRTTSARTAAGKTVTDQEKLAEYISMSAAFYSTPLLLLAMCMGRTVADVHDALDADRGYENAFEDRLSRLQEKTKHGCC